jgi:hypothetical protein
MRNGDESDLLTSETVPLTGIQIFLAIICCYGELQLSLQVTASTIKYREITDPQEA